MKKLFENWNNYLNEETIKESFKLRDYYDISTQDWMAMSGKERKQIRAKYKQEMAQKASQDAQPAGDQPAGEQESGDPAVIFIRQLAQTPFYKAVSSLTPEEMLNNLRDTDGAPTESGAGLELIGIVDAFFRTQASLAAKFYRDGDSGAGAQYEAITKFMRTNLNKVLAHYKLPPVPEIDLWKDDFDPGEMKAIGQSVPGKLHTGEFASEKVLQLGNYGNFADGDYIGVLASL